MKKLYADVVVCGGGTAGLPAALYAARYGKRVIVIERELVAGGAVPNFHIQSYSGWPRQGICHETSELMKTINSEHARYNNFRVADYLLAWQMLLDGLPVQLLVKERVTGAKIGTDGRITAVLTDTSEISGRVFIDATGDAALAIHTACPTVMGREARSTYNEPFAPIEADGAVQRCTLLYAVKRTEQNDGTGRASHFADFNDNEYLIWGPSVTVSDPTDETQLDAATQYAYAQMKNERLRWAERHYRITAIAPKIGVRETRRIRGEYILTARDMLDKKSYPDSIGAFQYVIDPWEPEGNPYHDADKKETCRVPYFEVPYRTLVTRAVPNMLVAGRCISATHVANSAIRVMTMAAVFGQAAGTAAALAIDGGTDAPDIDTAELQKRLTKDGVILSRKYFERDEQTV